MQVILSPLPTRLLACTTCRFHTSCIPFSCCQHMLEQDRFLLYKTLSHQLVPAMLHRHTQFTVPCPYVQPVSCVPFQEQGLLPVAQSPMLFIFLPALFQLLNTNEQKRDGSWVSGITVKSLLLFSSYKTLKYVHTHWACKLTRKFCWLKQQHADFTTTSLSCCQFKGSNLGQLA